MTVDEATPTKSYAEYRDDQRCAKCNAQGCKLWREYQTAMPTLMCGPCAAKDQGKEWPLRGTDQIGWYVPAVPCSDIRGYWGYCAVPSDAVAWWHSLPSEHIP